MHCIKYSCNINTCLKKIDAVPLFVCQPEQGLLQLMGLRQEQEMWCSVATAQGKVPADSLVSLSLKSHSLKGGPSYLTSGPGSCSALRNPWCLVWDWAEFQISRRRLSIWNRLGSFWRLVFKRLHHSEETLQQNWSLNAVCLPKWKNYADV